MHVENSIHFADVVSFFIFPFIFIFLKINLLVLEAFLLLKKFYICVIFV